MSVAREDCVGSGLGARGMGGKENRLFWKVKPGFDDSNSEA